MLNSKRITLLCTSLVIGIVMGTLGCAKEEYVKQQYVAQGSGVGTRELPAKVDILIVPDNTASVNMAFSVVQNQLSGFVSNLRNQFWDFHVARVPLYNPGAGITRVLVHPDFNSPYLADGTVKPLPNGVVPSDRAETNPSNFQILEYTYATNSADYGYKTIYSTLNNAKWDSYTNFFRQDALLAVIVLTNGTDSEVDPDGKGSQFNNSILSDYANKLISLKGSSKLLRFYPVASYSYYGYSSSNYCLVPYGTAFKGTSYTEMLSQGIKGIAANFCDYNSLQNVLSNINNDLQSIRQSYVYTNIVLDEEPVPGTIEIYRNGTKLSEDAYNGWTYKGLGSVYTVTAVKDESGNIVPINPGLNFRTGYVIQLNGSARFAGNESPQIIYSKK